MGHCKHGTVHDGIEQDSSDDIEMSWDHTERDFTGRKKHVIARDRLEGAAKKHGTGLRYDGILRDKTKHCILRDGISRYANSTVLHGTALSFTLYGGVPLRGVYSCRF